MHRFKNILYISRGVKDETEGLKQALSLTRNNKANLQVMIITPALPNNLGDYKDKYESSMISSMEAEVTKTAEAIGIDQNEITFSVILQSDNTPGIQVIQYVIENNHDLVIKEAELTDNNAGFKAIDMHFLRKCPTPVWLCRPIHQSRDNIKVAVAVDPITEDPNAISLSHNLLKLSAALAKDCSGDLHIVSCWDYEHEEFLRNNPWAKVDDDKVDEEVKKAEHDHRGALDHLVSSSEIENINSTVFHIRGRADEKILEFVHSNNIDILVMGTVARTGIPGLIIGNTAENIFHKINCSLIALKPDGFVSPVKTNS